MKPSGDPIDNLKNARRSILKQDFIAEKLTSGNCDVIFLTYGREVVYVWKCQWMHAILPNYSTSHGVWAISWSSHLTLLHYLNWWTLIETKGPGPVSWPVLELLFMLPVKRKVKGGGGVGAADLMCCWDITLRPHQAAPSASTREWFETVAHVTASLPVHSCESIAGHRSLMEDRCWERRRKTAWGIKDGMEKKSLMIF